MLAPRPAHVPAELVYDFDFYAPGRDGRDVHEAWFSLKAKAPPIFWTPRHGGHWVATSAEAIAQIQSDWEHFSHRSTVIPYRETHNFLPINLDPPEHTKFRRLLMPAFTPSAVHRLEARARDIARNLVQTLAPRGECEFIADFARILPVVVFLEMAGLPTQDGAFLAPMAEAVVRGGEEARAQAFADMWDYLGGWLERRRTAPGEDLLSRIVTAEVDGAPIREPDANSICQLVLFGGLDTVASLLGFVARFLAMHPEHRRQLVVEPELTPHAVEELIRRHGVSNTARYITQDYVFFGIQLKAGELIQQPNALYGLDPELFPDPMTVDFRRLNARRHLAFGSGPHLCPGNNLARREVRVFLETWLPQIPDFEIRPDSAPAMESGLVNGVSRLELCW